MTREQWARLTPEQRARYAARRAAAQAAAQAPARVGQHQNGQHQNGQHQRPIRPTVAPVPAAPRAALADERPAKRYGQMSRSTALSVVVAGTLIVGALGGVVLTRMLDPVFAFAQTTQRQAIHGDANASPTASAYASLAPVGPAATGPANQSGNHCAGNQTARRVIVSIAAQRAWYCYGNKAVYSTPVTTGMIKSDTQTPKGEFTIHAKAKDTVLTPNTGEQFHVKYWLAFSGTEYGFHDSSWQTVGYGSAKYRTSGSHGCVHLPLTAAKKLYSWARIGTAVTIA
jgi:lipoprotein-anchoring transpeptidase ErfK/SrfK